MKKLLLVTLCALFASLPLTASAQGVALGAKIGTLGPGLDLTVSLVDRLNLRVNGNYLKVSGNTTQDDIDYDADLTICSVIAILDWHPFGNNFRISAGGVYNGNELGLEATPTDSVNIGGTDYTPAQIGTLTGDATFGQFGPYIGIGFGNAVKEDMALTFVFDLGVIYTGSPKIDLRATGPIASLPSFQADLEDEEQQVEDDISAFKLYPVLAFGVAYHF